MGQCWTRPESAETSLNVLVGMSATEARARAVTWPDVALVESYMPGDLRTMEFSWNRVSLFLTQDSKVHRASFESIKGISIYAGQ
jgi:hypothetical protein